MKTDAKTIGEALARRESEARRAQLRQAIVCPELGTLAPFRSHVAAASALGARTEDFRDVWEAYVDACLA